MKRWCIIAIFLCLIFYAMPLSAEEEPPPPPPPDFFRNLLPMFDRKALEMKEKQKSQGLQQNQQQTPSEPSVPPQKEAEFGPVKKEEPVTEPSSEDRLDSKTSEIKPDKTQTVTKSEDKDREVSLFFDDADIYEVVHTVFGEILKVNYLIDPQVKGRITFRSVSPIKKENLLPIISTIFRLNGVGIMEENGLYRIIPLQQSLNEPVDIEFGRSPEKLKVEGKTIIQIVPLNFVPASEMKEILEPFLTKGAIITEVPNKNCLIISDTDENIKRLLKIVKTFDDELFAETKVKMFVIKNFNVKDVLESLQSAFPIFITPDREALKIRFIPIEKLNSILVVAPSERYIEEIGRWIEMLDSTFEGARPKIYVYPLQNSKADHVAEILQKLFLGTSTGGTVKKGSGSSKTVKTKSAGVPGAKKSSSAQQGTKTPLSTRGPVSSPLEEPLVTPGTKIFADEITNSLIILTTPRDYALIEDVIKQLDVVPRQVLIEAIIAEVSLSNDLQYGVEWFLKSHFNLDNTALTGYTVSGAPSLSFDKDTPFGSAGFTFAAVDSAEMIRGLLQTLASKSELKVLSSPHILVSDNREAKIQVGNQVPIVTSETNVTGTTNIQRTIQYRDTGVILKVKPQINDSGLVSLDISQEVSDVRQPITEGVESPVIFTRSAETTLVVRDGQSIILGGLIQENEEMTKEGIPLLSDLPLVGYLFGYQKQSKRRTELIVIITPRVIKNVSEADRVLEEFNQKLQSLQKLLQEHKTSEETTSTEEPLSSEDEGN